MTIMTLQRLATADPARLCLRNYQLTDSPSSKTCSARIADDKSNWHFKILAILLTATIAFAYPLLSNAQGTNHKGFMVVWEQGSGAEKWVCGYDKTRFINEVNAQHKKGMMLTWIEIYSGSSYCGVWHTGAIRQYVTLSEIGNFGDIEAKQRKAGLRIQTLDFNSGDIAAVWANGGGKEWFTLNDSKQHYDYETTYLHNDLNPQVVRVDGSNTFSWVGRSTQPHIEMYYNMSAQEFIAKNAFLKDGGYSVEFADAWQSDKTGPTLHITAGWRKTSKQSIVRFVDNLTDLKAITSKMLKDGLRMKVLVAYEVLVPDHSTGQHGPLTGTSCNAQRTVYNLACQGVAQHTFLGDGCGVDPATAEKNAVAALQGALGVCVSNDPKQTQCCGYALEGE